MLIPIARHKTHSATKIPKVTRIQSQAISKNVQTRSPEQRVVFIQWCRLILETLEIPPCWRSRGIVVRAILGRTCCRPHLQSEARIYQRVQYKFKSGDFSDALFDKIGLPSQRARHKRERCMGLLFGVAVGVAPLSKFDSSVVYRELVNLEECGAEGSSRVGTVWNRKIFAISSSNMGVHIEGEAFAVLLRQMQCHRGCVRKSRKVD